MKNTITNCMKWAIAAWMLLLAPYTFAQIPNWDMEGWNETVRNVPTDWFNFGIISKVSPGTSGQYAVKLQASEMEGPGAVLYGNPDGNGFTGGTPFTARPDSMVAWLKYQIDVGDSAWVIISFSKNGVNMGLNFYQYTGSQTSSFQRMAFKLNYTAPGNPDTVFVGFTSTNPEDPNGLNTNSWVILDNISFVGTTQNVPNPDFETWTSTTRITPIDWDYSQDPSRNAVERSTDKYAGNYCMKLQTKFISNDTVYGFTQTIRPNDPGNWGPAFPVLARHTSLKGFFKFDPVNGDSLSVNISMFKQGAQVGFGGFYSGATVSSWQPFSADINYFNLPTGAPDSATISIATFVNGMQSMVRGQSTAFIDNLSFDQYVYAGLSTATETQSQVMLYPNPTTSDVSLTLNLPNNEAFDIVVMDLNGRTVCTQPIKDAHAGWNTIAISVAHLQPGCYLIRAGASGNAKLFIE